MQVLIKRKKYKKGNSVLKIKIKQVRRKSNVNEYGPVLLTIRIINSKKTAKIDLLFFKKLAQKISHLCKTYIKEARADLKNNFNSEIFTPFQNTVLDC